MATHKINIQVHVVYAYNQPHSLLLYKANMVCKSADKALASKALSSNVFPGKTKKASLE
jgi:hypothetical protein